jgi:hypothetical protein
LIEGRTNEAKTVLPLSGMQFGDDVSIALMFSEPIGKDSDL